jgi:predicted aspartyl protease
LSDKHVNVQADIAVPYSEFKGVKTIPVKLNGVTMDMIFDTGCSGISMSLHELQTLYKNNKISDDDIIGVTYAAIADGSIVQNGLINLSEVQIGGKDGIVLHNVEASVATNQVAPILLGNGVIDKAASVEIDNINKVIKFKRR